MRRLHIRRVVGLAIVACLVCVAGASGLTIGLPFDGTQVNNDPMNGIDPNQDAGVSDVVGGSLAAGGPRVPWGTFEQKSGSSQQIFVRAFKGGQWVTQGQVAEHQPQRRGRGSLDRFRGHGQDRAVGLVV